MDQLKPEFLNKLMKFVIVSIWVLYILITQNFYLYRFTIQLVTHAVDKNYMFLLCNGLLLLVAKYSGFITSSKPIEKIWSDTHKTFDYRDFESYNAILELECCSVHDTRTESFLAEEVTKSQETEDKEEDYEEESELREESLNEEEEENVGVMTSTEEDINKKFDEFIRKMKEELRIEAKRQLILV